MHLFISPSSRIPIYEQIVEQIQQQILDGVLPENTQLPSVRAMAREYKISALTVKKAYDQLEQKGLVASVQGKGSYVLRPSSSMLARESMHKVEEALQDAADLARNCGMDLQSFEKLVQSVIRDKF